MNVTENELGLAVSALRGPLQMRQGVRGALRIEKKAASTSQGAGAGWAEDRAPVFPSRPRWRAATEVAARMASQGLSPASTSNPTSRVMRAVLWGS